MHHALQVLTDELRRLKAAGVKTVAVSDESVAALRRAVMAQTAGRAAKRISPAATPPVAGAGNSNLPAKTYESPAPRLFATKAAVPIAAVATMPAAPDVKLPAGDKAVRWA